MSNGTQPTLQELFDRYLKKQAAAHATGLADFDAAAEVTPYDAGPVQPIDPSSAWNQAVSVVSHFSPNTGVESISAPPNWPTLVSSQEPMIAVPFCVGNYPQMVRNLHQVLGELDVTSLRPSANRAFESPELTKWTEKVCREKHMPDLLFAVGALRLANNVDEASKVFDQCDADVPTEWRSAWENEKAASAWHRGECEEALASWQKMDGSVPVLFNLGMALLFLGKKDEARSALTEAVDQLPDSNAWHHLGRLYLTLAQF